MNAKQIKKLRDKLKLSQEQFAELIYVSQETVSQFESGKRIPVPGTMAHIKSVAKSLLLRLETQRQDKENNMKKSL